MEMNFFSFVENLEKVKDWQNLCMVDMKCQFLDDGFGRWKDKEWHPFVGG